MKTHLLSFQFALSFLFVALVGGLKGQVVISQVYGGGGNSGATYTNDYVELFNAGADTVNIGGWSIQYASNAGTTWNNHTVLPSFDLQPGQYYLIQQAAGNGGTEALPNPDLIPSSLINMAGANFKILLANDAVILSGDNPSSASIMDFAGFGTANAFEGAVGPGLSNTTAGFRIEGGCQDTNNNGADFVAATPAPRNSTSPLNVCGAVAVESVAITTEGGVPSEITVDNGTLQLIATVTPAEANQNVVWSIEVGSGLATVSAAGLVTAVDNGIVTVRAASVADDTIYDELEIAITNQMEDTVVNIEVAGGAAAEITTGGGTLQLIATVTPDGVSQDVVWSVVSGGAFGSVDSDGLVTALANGTVVVRATSVEDETAFDEISIVITNQVIAAAALEITTQGGVPAIITTDGGTLQLIATVGPTGASQDVEWSVTTVEGASLVQLTQTGLVTALANGTLVVRANSLEDEEVFDEITITITNQIVAATSVTVATQGGASTTITTAAGTVQLVATVAPAEASQNVVWSVQSGVGFVTVNQSGLVTAVANGIAVVRATSATTGTVFGEITITVDIISSVDELSAASIILFPNPTKDLLFVNSTEKITEVSVYNALGQFVVSSNMMRQVDLSSLENGLYIVKIRTAEGNTHVKNIIKQ